MAFGIARVRMVVIGCATPNVHGVQLRDRCAAGDIERNGGISAHADGM